jgi:diguanylate cyclase (GGDEF)-like protein
MIMGKLSTSKKAISFVTVYFLLHALFLFLLRNNKQDLAFASDSFQTIASMISGSWLLKKYTEEKSRDRKFWLFLSMTIFCYALGMLCWDYYELYLQVPAPFPGLADLFWALMFPLILIAYMYLMYMNRKIIRFGQMIYNTLIVVVVVITVSWELILKPILGSTFTQGTSDQAISILYSVGNIAILFVMLSLFHTVSMKFSTNVFLFTFTGTTSFLLADTLFLNLTSKGLYSSGNPVDLLWTMGILSVGVSAFFADGEILIVKEQADLVKISKKNWPKYFLSFRLWLPYVGVIFLLFMMVIQKNSANGTHIGSMISILLIVFRQMYTLVENDALLEQSTDLNKELEWKVEQRTMQINRKNQQLKDSIEKVEFMALHDPLTELPNRRYFEQKLRDALSHAKKREEQVAVFFFDLDRFKLINDTLGHTVGDSLLLQVAKRLQACVGNSGFISRHGGDEFLAFFSNMDERKAAVTAEKILESIRTVFFVGEHELFITTSIGIGLFPGHGSEADILTKCADAALFAAKNAFRNQFHFYDSSMNMGTVAELKLEKELHLALEKEEFILLYQPLIDVKTDSLKGAEALIRWNHPIKGLVSPEKFIPVSEENGFIIPLGLWVLKTACKQWKEWEERGLPPITLAVNISIKQFFHPNFLNQVRQVLEESGVNPIYLELEITENIFVSSNAQEILQGLKQLGIKISIDDFGTGYSSLQYLKRLPINQLKIDQSFIREIPSDANDVAIVQTIIAMAHHMNLEVVAEGVETAEQLNFLKKYQCHTVQGYFYSKPVAPEELEKMSFDAVMP